MRQNTVGNIYNLRVLTGAPLSYATWGQNVPDDIGKFNAQKIAKQLLGGNGLMDQAQQLRNIIKQQNMQQHLARVITVTSGKGGVGKSNMSVNMAIQLGRLGKKVVILDADFGLANVEVMLGTRPRYNMADMIYGRKGIKDIICRGPENIGFISGGSGIKELSNLSKDQISGIVNMMYELDSIADVIIIDTGAGISDAVIDMVLASSEVLLVTTPEPTSITDAYALLKTINKAPGYSNDNIKIKMIGNRTLSMSDGEELYNKLNSVVTKFLHMIWSIWAQFLLM